MKQIEENPKGLNDPICACGTNAWRDTEACLGFFRILQCSDCGANKVCEK